MTRVMEVHARAAVKPSAKYFYFYSNGVVLRGGRRLLGLCSNPLAAGDTWAK
jgi:hypothetical protein